MRDRRRDQGPGSGGRHVELDPRRNPGRPRTPGGQVERGKGGSQGGGGNTRPSGPWVDRQFHLPTGGTKKPSKGGGGGNPDAGPQDDATDPYTDFLNRQQAKYDQDAIDSLTNLFETYGLGSLAPSIAGWIRAGMSESAIVAQLRETPEYKKRFPGMAALKSQGYNAITEAEYLQLEDSYHQALQGAGLPAGFYDQPEDFVKFMSNGVDAQELKQRAVAAVDLAHQVDPTQRDLLSSMYGVGTGDIAAYFLDPKKAMPLLQRQLGAVQVGSAARHAGIQADYANKAHFERLVDNGIGEDQARQGYGQIASEMDPLKNLASIWGEGGWSLNEAEDATFFGNADAKKKRARIADRERAAFSGRSGFDARVSGRGNSAGSF